MFFKKIFAKFSKFFKFNSRKKHEEIQSAVPSLFPGDFEFFPNMIPQYLQKLNIREKDPYVPDISPGFDCWEELPVSERETLGVDLEQNFNSKYHKTNQFAMSKTHLMVRRGHYFRIQITLHDELTENEELYLLFQMVGVGQTSTRNGSRVVIKVERNSEIFADNKIWRAALISSLTRTFSVLIITPANCPVSPWILHVFKAPIFKRPLYIEQRPIYVLFNPWCRNDEVYLEEKDCREYVLQDRTDYWVGTLRANTSMLWTLDQYNPAVLETCFYLLREVYPLTHRKHGSAIEISRALSSAVNANDNGGVLRGDWKSNKCLEFTGSGAILAEYISKKRPVDGAQCWIFACVYCSLARALGLPCRVITCFRSVHVYNFRTLLANVVTGSKTRQTTRDHFMWNFHCWNEVWMKRPDLDTSNKYDGWQVCDATPQERSDELFRTGPSSVNTIKQGEILYPYDTAYVYSEVNADLLLWSFDELQKKYVFLSADTSYFGRRITTKEMNTHYGNDITNNYKYEEGTQREREIMKHALSLSQEPDSLFYVNNFFKDIRHSLSLNNSSVTYGEPIPLMLSLSNMSEQDPFRVSGTFRADLSAYNGLRSKPIKIYPFDLEIPAKSKKEIDFTINYEDYCDLYKIYDCFQFEYTGTVDLNNHIFTGQMPLMLNIPEIGATMIDPSSSSSKIIFKLENPSPVTLHKCRLDIRDSVSGKNVRIKADNIPRNGNAFFTYLNTIEDQKEWVCSVCFRSKEMKFSRTYLVANGKIV